ncbi:uncharacterized protein LOC143287188 [Babylonia areolata]|uniref:uncharacterized protein LOC143287188 n=1 Tax=Babylonia areolata TaxID=304850 RepID=UPI003FD069BA
MLLFCMLVVFFVLGVVGNALAFYIYYQKRDKTTSTLFILSLAATDFFTCLVGIPYTLANEMLKYWLLYDLVCKCYLFVMTFNIPLSAFIMVAVGFDRYFCICHPFLHVMTVRRAKICLVCLTLLACGLGIITALGYGVYYLESGQELVLDTALSTTTSTATATGTTTTTVRTLFTSDTDSQPGSAYSIMNATNSHSHSHTKWPLLSPDTAPSSSDSTTSRLSAAAASNNNDTDQPTYRRVNASQVVYLGMCVPNQLIFSSQFSDVYQKVYAATFLFSFLIIAILYALIYRSILIRRAWKAKRKRMSCYASTANGPETVAAVAAEETQLTNINNGNTVNTEATAVRASSRTSVALRDRMLYANIKTAAMLFVVTVVFIISFLPSWLIGLDAINMNLILFYIFFLNNVANPFIYAFMNRTFRDDLRQLLKRMKNRLAGW